MFETARLLVLIPALPLAGCLLAAVLGPRWLRARSHLPVVAAIAAAFAASLILLGQVRQQAAEANGAGVGVERVVTLWRWAAIDECYQQRVATGLGDASAWRDLVIDVTLRADPLTAIMLVTVTFVALLVAVYSIGYMHDDPGYWRFFAYLGLFVFSMTMLVSVSNFVLLYVFWEAVGLCSYLLIGFWYHKPEAAAAGKKAFLVNRIGDFGFALGVFLLWTIYGTLDFHDTSLADGSVVSAGILGQSRLAGGGLLAAGPLATVTCLLLFVGACGKSAQFPLHVWLPDAMEGPTPVSALIHAATMVTAGVYMVARCMPLFVAAPDALQVVAAVGTLTALLGALIALTQTDLKRILAYSTISQLGYMFLGLGAGTLLGATAGMFHLFTHAFFKALLFLAAGSVMHAMGGVIDVRRFGGLWRRLPTTHWTFLFGGLALAGAVPFAGFWSKDQILVAVAEQAAHNGLYQTLYWSAIITAGLTAFYTFRAYFLTFHGPEVVPAEAGHHAHESPATMTVPLMILAGCALGVGAWFEYTHGFAELLSRTPSLAFVAARVAEGEATAHRAGDLHGQVMVLSIVVATVGMALAALVYWGARGTAGNLARAADLLGLYRLSYGKFFFDPLYDALVVRPLELLAALLAWADRCVIDGVVDGTGRLVRTVGASMRPLQGGMIQFYALAMVLGLLVLMGVLML